MKVLLLGSLGWYYQIQDLLGSKSFSSDSFSIFIPGIDYTYVFDNADIAHDIKMYITYIVYAGTALSCVRIAFQIFGIHIRSGGDDQ